MNRWTLPDSVMISETKYIINTDYRDILDILRRLNDLSEDEATRIYIALALFYEDFEHLPERDYSDAIKAMFDFIRCGEPEAGREGPKRIDWEQDAGLILADINRVSGHEIREVPYCHWWTFMAWFNAIGEGQLSTVVSIREKRRKGKKLDDWEREYYRENRERIDFKTEYTPEEEALLQKMLGK